MKYLLITIEYPPFKGGVANYYENVVKNWPDSSEIYVLNNNDGKLIKQRWPTLKWVPGIFVVYKNIIQKKIDHVIVGQILPLGTVAYFLSKFLKIKYSIIFHGMDLDYAVKYKRKSFLTHLILKNSSHIVCSNHYVAEKINTLFPSISEKISVVNPGIDTTQRFDKKLDLRNKYNLNDRIILVTVGRLVKRKGVDYVLECLPEVVKKNPSLYYIIVGNGEEAENYRSSIIKNNLDDHAMLIENSSDAERNAWYNEADIFIMPSRNIDGDYEGFGIVYLEANLAGKPVIAGDSGGVKDAVIDQVNGLLVNPESKEEIARAIIELSTNSDLRLRLGEQGRARVLADFSWKEQIKKLDTILKDILL